ncbi:MAG: hypothetical protein WC989_04205 [Micavibrio sp.]
MFFKPAETKFGKRQQNAPGAGTGRNAGARAAEPALPAAAPAAGQVTGDVNKLLRALIVAVTNLRDVLLRENDALDHSNSQAFMDLQDEKVAIARHYEGLMVSLLNRTDLQTADTRLRSQLLSLEEGFSTVMKDNMEKLERMRGATERLGEQIMSAARKSAENMSQFAYGSAGTMQKGGKATIGLSEQA